jgi:hypothetical protein
LLIYTDSRGKKVFRPFQSTEPGEDGEGEEDAASTSDADQRRLRHQAGPAAQRPLTRSTIKPRLLFPSAEQRAERERGVDDIDEEAITDIEMDNTNPTTTNTIANGNGSLASPPPTQHKKGRTVKAVVEFTPGVLEDDGEPMSLGTDESLSSTSGSGKKGKGKSPFDAWQRTKGGRKRAGDASEEGGGKRTRSAAACFEGAVV